MLTVLTWLWQQPESRTQYNSLHVNIWADMVRRNLSIPHRIACVTDLSTGIDSKIDIIKPPRDFENVRIPSWKSNRPQCFRRLAMFRSDAAQLFGSHIVCMDLDCVIGGPIDQLFLGEEDFRITRGTALSRPYNGSLMMIKAGARPQVYNQFTPQRAAEAGRNFMGSDQAWLAHILGPDEAVWIPEDGVLFHGVHSLSKKLIMFFNGNKKPWDSLDHWALKHYRKAVDGKCLILGYGPKLWEDVDRALDNGPYCSVIASPEAAQYWPGDLLAVVETNNQAAKIAFMHGFIDVTWCGVEEREVA